MHDGQADPPTGHGITVVRDGRSAVVRMDRGTRPFTLTIESVAVLRSAWSWARRVGLSVIVLAGSQRAWCVGGDIDAFASSERPDDYVDELATALHQLVSEITRADAICIAAIDGVVAGAGTPLAAAADIVVSTDRARFTLGYTKIALSPDGGTTLLSATVGLHPTLYAALLNPTWTAQEAHRRGLVAEVVEPQTLDQRVGEVARQLAALPPAALSATKHLVRQQALPHAEAALSREAGAVRTLAATADAREAFRAFVDKRPPQFST